MKYQLNKQDSLKIGKGLLIAMVGAGLTYLAEVIPNIDFQEFTPLMVVAFSVLVNAIRKYLQQ